MHKQTLAVAVLALGVVLASVPAMAQSSGRNVDDGGQVQAPQGDYYAPQTSKKHMSMSAAPTYYGRALNDGGINPATQGDYYAPQTRQSTSNAPAHLGRAPDDGGM